MKTEKIELSKLHPFAGHPYKVRDDAEMETLTDSILEQGILSPLLVRPTQNGEYEIIAGHRRFLAARKAGLETVPAFVMPMDRDSAAIALVDSNLNREHLLPSEKAFAYKLKMEALAHQGKTCGQVGHKSREDISVTESGRTVQRYIRLTHLIPELLDLVDERKIALTPAVHMSYLTEEEQSWVLEDMEMNDCTPSVSQAYHLKEKSVAGTLTRDFVAGILCQEKANQKERLRIPMERIRKYFPKSYTNAQMEDTIVKLCESYHRRRMDRER